MVDIDQPSNMTKGKTWTTSLSLVSWDQSHALQSYPTQPNQALQVGTAIRRSKKASYYQGPTCKNMHKKRTWKWCWNESHPSLSVRTWHASLSLHSIHWTKSILLTLLPLLSNHKPLPPSPIPPIFYLFIYIFHILYFFSKSIFAAHDKLITFLNLLF